MALADRHYMRGEFHSPRVTTRLIVVLIVAFVIQSLLLFYGDLDLLDQLALSANGLSHGRVWQLFTFQFLHQCPWPFHVLFNCLGLYFFGRPVEEILGARRFLAFYLTSGVAGGLLQVVTTVGLPRHPDFPVVGASAGVCGLIAIFCTLHPMDELTTWIYFLPITIRARYFLMGLGLFSLFGTLVPLGGIAHAAHLGGILAGIGYVRYGDKLGDRIFRWGQMPRGLADRPSPKRTRAKNSPWRDNPAKAAQETTTFISREVDPILDKIAAHGMQSLTEHERQVLEAARKRMG
jgi:membrane associated rhomboid family serine protease